MAGNGERIPKKTRCLNSSGGSEKRQEAEIVSELRQKYPLKAVLKLSGLPRSTYYYRSRKQGTDKYEAVKQEIKRIFYQNEMRLGYHRMYLALRNEGIRISHKTVYKLMKSMDLHGKMRRSAGKYNSYKGEVGKIAPNILNRNFKAEKPFEKLAADVTMFTVCNRKVYLSAMIDMYNNEIVSYSISQRADFEQTRRMLQILFEKLPQGARPILHTDQGWQYQMREYQMALKEHNIIQSMSRKATCLDNCVIETFFGRLKSEFFHGEKFQTVDEFIYRLEEYLYYWNNERITLKLNGMTPVQYRTLYPALQ